MLIATLTLAELSRSLLSHVLAAIAIGFTLNQIVKEWLGTRRGADQKIVYRSAQDWPFYALLAGFAAYAYGYVLTLVLS